MKLIPPTQPLQTHAVRARLGSRLALLALCAGIGAVIGVVGRELTASDAWFLAVPLGLVIGWWVVADPTTCAAAPPSRGDDGRGL